MTLTLVIICSCETKHNEDPKNVAKEHNTAKFSDLDQQKEAQFIVNEAEFCLAQICLLRLAQENSIDPKTQTTGKTLEKEYIKLYGLFKDLGEKKQISVPIETGADKKKICIALSYEIAEEFDEKFHILVIKNHRDAIQEAELILKEVKDPELHKLIKNTIPDLRRNLAYILLNIESKEK
jgi:Domain of unknown function (DUF4142)